MSELPALIGTKCYPKSEKLYYEKDDLLNKKSFYKSNKGTDETIKESDEGSINLDLKLGGLSSSSSLSWSDEYESEVTKKLYEKLKRIDRVLKQQEDFPSHYDKDEFGQWMHTFPNVSIFDTARSCDKDLLVLNNFSSRKRDKLTSLHNQREVPVINNSEFTYNRLLTQRSGNNRKRHLEDVNFRNKNIFTIASKPKNLDRERSLKVIPVKNPSQRKLSTKSLQIHKDTKEYIEFPPQFDSLPFIEIDQIFGKNRKFSSTLRNTKYVNFASDLHKTTDLLILPPIQGNKLRSISATPNQDKPSKLFLI